jgi:hypothetical protein
MRLVAIALALGAGLFAFAQPAECVYCPSYRCYAPCAGGCTCITSPGESGGACYGVQHAERLVRAGWVRLGE